LRRTKGCASQQAGDGRSEDEGFNGLIHGLRFSLFARLRVWLVPTATFADACRQGLPLIGRHSRQAIRV
jgi:hypothetical protein